MTIMTKLQSSLGFLAVLALLGMRPADSDAGLSERVRSRMQQFVSEHEIAGAVTLIGRADGVIDVQAVGLRDIEAKDAMRPDSIFRIMSMTKPITAIAILMLVDEGKLALDDTVEKHLPEFRGQKMTATRQGDAVTLASSPRPVTIRDLLTHTSGVSDSPPTGYPDLDDFPRLTMAEAVRILANRPLDFAPGSRWKYSNAGLTTLGRLVEAASGRPFDAFLKERIFNPLGMVDTTFYPTAEQMRRVAVIYGREGGTLHLLAWSKKPPKAGIRYPSPAGGLFSTAPDLARLYRLMLNRGTLDGRRYLSEPSVAAMTRLQTGDLKTGFVDGMGFGLGWGFVREPSGATAALSAGTYGHGGMYGSQGWIDPHKGKFVILLIQRDGLENNDDTPMRRELQRIAFELK
jgi:CubicO group peptidase (beta-lactamase class C family)